MTVKELKEFLKNVPDDFEIVVRDDYQQEDFEIDENCILVRKEEKQVRF